MKRLHPVVTLVIGLALLVLALVVLIAVSGFQPTTALAALWRGAFGSEYAIFSATLVRATPLILTGLAVAFAFTSGVLNIGAEGQLLAGAAAATTVALALGTAPAPIAIPAALSAGAIAGAGWAFVPAWLRRRFRVLEVISTLMMNFIALHLVSFLVRGPLQEPTRIYPQTSSIADGVRLPVFGGTRLHAGFVVAIALAVLLRFFVRRTAAGFRIRAVGMGPTAAASAGKIDVARTTMRAFLASGALAGLAGAVEVTGVTYALYENISPGYGYTAIAVALLARLDPMLVAASGIFFGGLEAGAAAMQRDAGVPSVLVSVIEAVMVLGIVALGRFRITSAKQVAVGTT
jgi:general nucleoside transport system permease protein